MSTIHSIHRNRFFIKGLLVTEGISQKEIAEATKKSPEAVSQVIANKRTSSLIRTEIATRLGKSVSQLWPKRKRRRTKRA
jgi:predicted transcriptional regulator